MTHLNKFVQRLGVSGAIVLVFGSIGTAFGDDSLRSEGGNALSATGPQVSTSFECKQGIVIEFVSLDRAGPGLLQLVLSFANNSNNDYRFRPPQNASMNFRLLDDKSGQWRLQPGTYRKALLGAGMTRDFKHVFKIGIGGDDATWANFYGKLGFNPMQGKGSYGECAFQLTRLPIGG